MKIAIVTPRATTSERGGAESLYDGLLQAFRAAGQEAERVEALLDESSFDAVLASYLRFYELDLSDFDMLVSTKGPTYMARHPNHVSYLLHTTRVFYDMFEHEYGAGTREQLEQRALIHQLDQLALHPKTVRAHFANGNETFKRLQITGAAWREINFRALHHPSSLTGYQEPRRGEYVLLPGRLHRWKRADLVIQAYRHLRRDVPLKVVGTGEDKEALRQLAGDDPRIEFLGQVSDEELVDLYAGALVVPFVPINEDFGLITIEAFNSGKPVITCNDSGEPVNFVRDYANGFVVEPDPRAIADRITFFADHPSHAAEMGLRGREDVAHITWERVVSTMLAAGRQHAGDARSRRVRQNQGAVGPASNAPQSARSKYKVAVLDMQPIEPPVGGGRLRLLGLYHNLGEDLATTYLGSYDWPGPGYRRVQHSPTLEEVTVPLSDAHFAAAKELGESAGGKTVIDSAFPQLGYLSHEYVGHANDVVAASDVVVFSHPWVYPLVKQTLRSHPQAVVYDSHNVEGYLRRTLLEDGGAGSQIASRVEEVERELCGAADLILACSPEDRRLFNELYGVPLSKIEVVPNGTFTNSLTPASPAERAAAREALGIERGKVAVFIGSPYVPNEEAAAFIVDELAPAFPDVIFVICGGVGEMPRFAGHRAGNVIFTGVIDSDELKRCLQAADVAINPMFSGSGTNIKMFDFMAAGLPIVTTAVGARGIEHESEPAYLHCERDDFAASLRRVLSDEVGARRLAKTARGLVERCYSWEGISRDLGVRLWQLRDALPERTELPERATAKVGLLSTWKTRCGIAEYTGYLTEGLRREGSEPWILGVAGEDMSCRPAVDASFSVPIEDMWRYNWVDPQATVTACLDAGIRDLSVQYHTGFFEGDSLCRLTSACVSAGIAVSVMMHDSRSMDPAVLRDLAGLGVTMLAHSESEVEALKARRLPVTLLPHGLIDIRDVDKTQARASADVRWNPTIGTFGFLRPHKGVLNLIEAVPHIRQQFPNAGLLMQTALYPSGDSSQYLQQCVAAIERLNLSDAVRLDHSFRPIEDVIGSMQACDLIVVPYDASQEGASGSASICLAARRPVLTSDSAVFSSIRHVTYPLPATDPKSIAEAVTQFLRSPGLQEDYQRRAASYVADHAWPVVAREFLSAIAGAGQTSHDRLPQLEVAI